MEVLALLVIAYGLGRLGYRRSVADSTETKAARTPPRPGDSGSKDPDWSRFHRPAYLRRRSAPLKGANRRRSQKPQP